MIRAMQRAVLLSCALAAAGCGEALYTGLSEVEANRMRATLLQHGIDATKRDAGEGRWSLDVSRDAAGRALQVLESAGLPAQKFGSTIESMRSDALVPSAGEDRARLAHGLSQELAQTIGGMDGVVHARVHLSIPEKPTPGQRVVHPPSASVFVRHRPGHNLAAMSLAVKLLVARSVEGMTPERVSVITVALEPSPPAPVSEAARPMAPKGVAPTTVAAIGVACALLGSAATLVAGAAPGAFRPRRGESARRRMTSVTKEAHR